jgi:signal transduction histidine kinase
MTIKSPLSYSKPARFRILPNLSEIDGGYETLTVHVLILTAILLSTFCTMLAISELIRGGSSWGIVFIFGSALTLAFTAWLLQHNRIPQIWLYPTGAIIIGLVTLDIQYSLWQTSNPLTLAFLCLILVSSGYVILSKIWLAVLLLFTLCTWLVMALANDPPYWGLPYAIGILTSGIIAQVFRHYRVRMLDRLIALQKDMGRFRGELENVLVKTEESQRSLATSIAVSQRLTSILDLEELLQQVSGLIQQHFRCQTVSVFLIDPSSDDLVFQAGINETGRSLQLRGLRIKIGKEGIIGWVAFHKHSALVTDVSLDPRYLPVKEIPNVRSELALPLEVGHRLLGVLDMQSNQTDAFHEEDLPFMQLVADQVAISINNASLYQSEKSRRQLAETLIGIGQMLSGTLDTDQVLAIILEKLADIVPFDRAAVMLQEGNFLKIVASRGFPPDQQEAQVLIKENDVFDEICRTQQPLSIPDVLDRSDWQHLENIPQARAWLGLPLSHNNEIIGMLSLARYIPNAYQPDDIPLAATFAAQAAVALKNARLYEQIHNFNLDLENLVTQRTMALQKAYNQLEELDRAKSGFINIASHELRTPLTVTQGYTQMLLENDSVQSSPSICQLVNGISTGVIRMQEIIESLLDAAKIDNRELRLSHSPIPVASLVAFVMEMLKSPIQERNLKVVTQLRNLPEIEADVSAMRKVIYHLLSNAIKYTPNGGEITITGRAVLAGETALTVDGIEVIVSDTGIGIDPEYHELIFTKFFQTGSAILHSTSKTKFKGGGPGLGLGIVMGIVKAHGGIVWVESPGFDEVRCPGSHFHVVLPLRQNAERAA